MNTLAEIQREIEKLSAEQQAEIRHWMDTELPKTVPTLPASAAADFDTWLVQSTGLARGILTTDEQMRETRGEDGLPVIRAKGPAITSALVREIEGLGA